MEILLLSWIFMLHLPIMSVFIPMGCCDINHFVMQEGWNRKHTLTEFFEILTCLIQLNPKKIVLYVWLLGCHCRMRWMANQKAMFMPCQKGGTFWGHLGSVVRYGIPICGKSAGVILHLCSSWLWEGCSHFWYLLVASHLCVCASFKVLCKIHVAYFLCCSGSPKLHSFSNLTDSALYFVHPALVIIMCLCPGGPPLHISAASDCLLILPLCFSSKRSQVNRPLVILQLAQDCCLTLMQFYKCWICPCCYLVEASLKLSITKTDQHLLEVLGTQLVIVSSCCFVAFLKVNV